MYPCACSTRRSSSAHGSYSYQNHPCHSGIIRIFNISFSCLIMIICMMFLSRGSVRAASWIPHHRHRHHHHHHPSTKQSTARWFRVTRWQWDQGTRQPTTTKATAPVYPSDRHCPSRRAFPSSTALFQSTSSTPSSSSWNIGDKIWIQPQQHDRPRQAGVIQESRGGGWYSVQLVDRDDDQVSLDIVKVRGTRLKVRQNRSDDNVMINEGNGNNGNKETTVKIEEQYLSRPPFSSTASPTQQQSSDTDWQNNLPVVDSATMFRNLAPIINTKASPVATSDAKNADLPQIDTPASDVSHTFETMNGPVSLEPTEPTIIDLDTVIHVQSNQREAVPENLLDGEYLRQVAHHAQMEQWVVFTDLHVGPSTLTTCLQVLDFVHQQAITRNAGIVFLGDFWHQRGVLRVDCLNAVLQALSTWKVPMIMIPGNHDQVTLGGHLHGLTALKNAYRVGGVPGPLIFSHPTVFRQALWVPHIREHANMESVLQSPAATAQNMHAVLCHADITGAYMNDLMVSTGGVPPRWFPSGIPIYSGHFHKPHMVEHKAKNIEYLGSPYQVSLAEAHQPKSLAVMDDKWRIVERIPIQIGRLHFRPKTVKDFLQLQHADSRKGENICCPGDRIVFSVDKMELEQLRREAAAANNEPTAVDIQAKRLRKAGVSVEIREVDNMEGPTASSMGDAELEELSPESTWKAFLNSEVERGVLSKLKAEQLQKAGLEILETVQELSSEMENTAAVKVVPTSCSKLEFQSIAIEGFGPFDTLVEYPLTNRGLVLVRGINRDDGSDSNGTGKSSLAMAALWALTGSLDPRPLPDGKVADVVHDNSKVARVTLRGVCNGRDFTVVRSKTNSRGSLTFFHDGEDLTTQSVRETQLVIDEVLGISTTILSRSVFFGQHPLNDLLDSADTRFKDELALLVPLATWQEVLAVARKRGRDCEKRINELQGMISIRQTDLSKIIFRQDAANVTYRQAADDFRKREETLLAELGAFADFTVSNTTDWVEEAEAKAEELSVSIQKLEAEREAYESDRKKAEERLLIEINKFKNHFKGAEEDLKTKQRVLDVAQAQYQNSLKALEKLEAEWQLDLRAVGSSDLRLPDNCPTCGQPLSEESGAHAQSNIQETINTAWESRRSAEYQVKGALDALKEAEAFHAKRAASLVNMEDTRSETLSWLDKQIDKVNKEIRKAWQEKEQYTVDLATATRKRQKWIEARSVEQKLEAEREALARINATVHLIPTERQQCEETVRDLKLEQKRESEEAALMKDLATSFSQRGVQVFVLRHALEALQVVSQTYLDDLSDSTLDLRLSLDDGDRILRQVGVSSGGEKSERSLASLSGGQWRRCSLALQLGFADLLSRRGQFESSLLVFDEPLTHLDQSGRAAFGRVLRRLLRNDRSTIILILQDLAAEELVDAFDAVDEVVKSRGRSMVNVDSKSLV